MFRSIANFLERLSTGRMVILSLVIYIVFMVYFLPAQAAKAKTYTGDAGSIDLSFFPSVDEAYAIAEAYGEEGRSQYIVDRVTFDLAWPLAYTFFTVALITFCLKRIHGNDSKLKHLNLLAVAGMLFDFLENGFAIGVMSAYPERLDAMVWGTSVFNLLKWVTIGASNLVMLYGILALPVVLLIRRRAKADQT